MVLDNPGPLLTPPSSSSLPKTPHQSYSGQKKINQPEQSWLKRLAKIIVFLYHTTSDLWNFELEYFHNPYHTHLLSPLGSSRLLAKAHT